MGLKGDFTLNNHQQTIYIGKTLQRLRKEQKMNQDDLAYLSGLTREYISLLERNQYDPTLRTIERLAKSLGMLPSEFIKEAEKDSHSQD